MQFGKVIGNIVATRKEGNTQGLRLFVVKYLDENLEELENSAACFDTVQDNVGDIVLLCASSSARMTQLTRFVCADNVIVGIVDSVAIGKTVIFPKK